MSAVPIEKAGRWQIAIWALATALAAFLSLRHFDAFQIGAYTDDAVYVVLARSLVGHRGFGLIYTPAPEPLPSPFPFGYPLLLAPLVALQPDNAQILKLPSLLATLTNGALLFWGWHWFSRRSRWWGLAVASLYLVLPYVIDHSRMVMSEAVFATLCLLAALLTEQIARGKPGRWRACLLGGVLAYTISTRSVGIVIVPALGAYLLWRKGRAAWPAIALVCVAGLALAGLLLLLTPVGWDGLLPVRYLTERNNSLYLLLRQAGAATGSIAPSDLPPSAGETTHSALLLALERAGRHLTVDLRRAVLPVGGGPQERELALRLGMPWLSTTIGLLTLGLVAVGWLVWWRKDGMTAFGLGAAAYLGASLLWDWRGPRLLYPVAPQLMLCLLIGFEALVRAGGAATMRGLSTVSRTSGELPSLPLSRAWTVGWALLLGCLSVYASIALTDSRLHAGDLSLRTAWLRANAPASAVIMSEQPATDFLYSARHTVPQPSSFGSTADLEGFLTRARVDYILVGPALRWQTPYAPAYSPGTTRLLPLLAELQAAGRLTKVYALDQDRIVVFKSESP